MHPPVDPADPEHPLAAWHRLVRTHDRSGLDAPIADDVFRWNEAGAIVDFEVMLRPSKAVDVIHQRLGARLQAPA